MMSLLLLHWKDKNTGHDSKNVITLALKGLNFDGIELRTEHVGID